MEGLKIGKRIHQLIRLPRLDRVYIHLMNLRKALRSSLLLLLAANAAALARESATTPVRWLEQPVNTSEIISQQPYEFGCGYGAILNALYFTPAGRAVVESFGVNSNQERMKYLIDHYGMKPSRAYSSGTRQRSDGVCCRDLCDLYNDVRADRGLPVLSGRYLSRDQGESDQALLQRVHDLLANSLLRGEPPIVHLRSEAVHYNPKKKDFVWDGLMSHFVTVIGVSTATSDDGSFSIDYLDPADGQKRQMLAYVDVRNFTALRGDNEHFDWLNSRPFISVTGGSLYLTTQKQPWSSRSEIYLHYAIAR